MKITEHIAKAKKQTQFTFEILPPLKGQNINSLFEAIDLLMDFNPPFIDVTYHREEHVYKEVGKGLLEKKSFENARERLEFVPPYRVNTTSMLYLISFVGGLAKKTQKTSLLTWTF